MKSQAELNWDNVRIFLAVARAKSLRKAADLLEMSHPTVSRRLEALEKDLGVTLFARSSEGLHATPEASELLGLAEQIESSFHALGRHASNAAPALKGVIHISAPDLIISDLLAPELARFSAKWPQIELRVEATYELADLRSREADIAFRIYTKDKQPHPELAGRKAGTLCAAIYGEEHQWIGWWDEVEQRDNAKETPYPDTPIRHAFNNIYMIRSACLAGMGLAMLPCFMAVPELVRRTEPAPAADIWILIHPDLRRNPRLRLFRDEMVSAFQRLRPRLEGQHLE